VLKQISCSQLVSVGAKTSEKLANLGINNVEDLLWHLPNRYIDKSKITPIRNLQVGDCSVIEGKIVKTASIKTYRPNFLCFVQDQSGMVVLRFLHFFPNQAKLFQEGKTIRCYGVVRLGKNGLEIVHPEYTFFEKEVVAEQFYTPVYSATEGVSQKTLQKLTAQSLALLKKYPVDEYLPTEILEKFNLPNLSTALNFLHQPPITSNLDLLNNFKHPAQLRLIYDELLAHLLGLKKLRATTQSYSAPPLLFSTKIAGFLKKLPFVLTNAQQKVLDEISNDISKTQPMLRLLQGDVGSGKTVVAVVTALQAVTNGYQVAIMAPTELLAEQHFQSFKRLLADFDLQIACLVSKLAVQDKKAVLANIAKGSSQVIIGTHALFQKTVEFAKLGLVIIDEQHRFGVHQRLALWEKGKQGENFVPHNLIMTATPIPRTLAMVAYADLDCSVIDEMPKGRKPITTLLFSNKRRHEILEWLNSIFAKGQQAYWVCPLISESEQLNCQAAESLFQELINLNLLPNVKVALLHGQMATADKIAIMQQFKDGKIQLLVATTIIEVGVDVSNATAMVIENPERLGLAQLHQLRGRVGRGAIESYCVLLYQAPLSRAAKDRLLSFKNTNDGFVLAQKDLELRGAGEILGSKQAGMLQMRFADLLRDQYLFPQIQEIADMLLKNYPKITTNLYNHWLELQKNYIMS
jgi:ATP-dependent DNA helicase RecG